MLICFMTGVLHSFCHHAFLLREKFFSRSKRIKSLTDNPSHPSE